MEELADENASSVTAALDGVFVDFGPPSSILTDNAPVFLSRAFSILVSDWQVHHERSCAYRHQGNGICERIHRTIKRMASRSGCLISKATFYYNSTTNQATGEKPVSSIFRAVLQIPRIRHGRVSTLTKLSQTRINSDRRGRALSTYKTGDMVFLRPPDGRCTSKRTGPHRVASADKWTVDLGDGVNRHVSHVRLAPSVSDSSISSQYCQNMDRGSPMSRTIVHSRLMTHDS